MKYTFISKVLHKDSCNIHYWMKMQGDFPWLVYLHGADADHMMFSEQMESVGTRFNILLWDTRGHGWKYCAKLILQRRSSEIPESEATRL